MKSVKTIVNLILLIVFSVGLSMDVIEARPNTSPKSGVLPLPYQTKHIPTAPAAETEFVYIDGKLCQKLKPTEAFKFLGLAYEPNAMAIEIGSVCACTVAGGNTLVVTFNNWPTSGGPYTAAINYTRTVAGGGGYGVTSVSNIPAAPSGTTTVTFGPVTNLLDPSGNIFINSVVNQSNISQPINISVVGYTISGPLTLTSCSVTEQDVNTSPGVCTGIVPDLTGTINYTGGCNTTVKQSPTAGSTFGTTCGSTQVVTVTATDVCGGSISCSITLTLVDAEDPVQTTSPLTSSTVSCPDDTDTPPATLPVVRDNCGGTIPAPTPVISTKPTCEGTRTYTYTYSDGCGNDIDWVYTYTVDYSGGLTAPTSTTSTVSCPADAVDPGAPAPITDACGRTVSATYTSVTNTPDPLTCEGTRVYTYTYTACDGTTTATWTHTYTIDYSGGLTAPTNSSSTVSCPSDATDPGAPAPITDACGRTVNATYVGVSDTPNPVTCEGSRVYTYRYTACDGTTTADWTYTYTIDYSGGLTAPTNGSSTVSCPSSATDPGAPANITDACGRTVSATYVGVSDTPNPVTCEGSRVYTYRYTACDGTTTADWTYTYTIDYSGGLTAPTNGSNTVSCSSSATDPGAPANITDACGRTVSATYVGVTNTPDPISCEGTRVYTYRYTACDGTTTADWTYTYTIDYSGGLTAPANSSSTVSCPSSATDPGAPADITDACGRTVSATYVGVTNSPNPITCEGTRVYTYRYTACDGTTTADWTYTYTIDYSGGLTAPTDASSTVNCPSDATDPGAPAPITDGCGRTVNATYVGVINSPNPLTCAGTRVYTYRYTACDGTTTDDWTYTYTVSPPAVSLTPPADFTVSPSCQTQTNVNNAFNTWLNGVTYSGGCNASISDNNTAAPNYCGGSTTVTWTVTSDCETPVTASATFTVTAPASVVLTAPANSTQSACQTQEDIDNAYTNWLNGVTSSGGCDRDVTDNAPDDAPSYCGGSVTVTWTATSSCEADVVTSATFTVTDAPDVVLSAPSNLTVASCQTQAAVDAAFNSWVASATFSGGCNAAISATGDNNYIVNGDFETGDFTGWTVIPGDGGSFIINDGSVILFEDGNSYAPLSGNYDILTLQGGPGINIVSTGFTVPSTIPSPFTLSWVDRVFDWSDDLSDPEQEVRINLLDASMNLIGTVWSTNPGDPSIQPGPNARSFDIGPLLAPYAGNMVYLQIEQEDNFNYFNYFIDNITLPKSPDHCGESATITWTVTSGCEPPVTASATFTVPDAPVIVYTAPVDRSVNACDYDSQMEIDDDFVDWLDAQELAMGVTGGCASPTVTNDGGTSGPTYCASGSKDVTWTISSLCETITVTATYTINFTPAILSCPDDKTVDLGSTNAQVLTEFTNFVNEGSYSGTGCMPSLTDNSSSLTLPSVCDGGSVTVVWTLTSSACQTTQTCSATFTVPDNALDAIVTGVSTVCVGNTLNLNGNASGGTIPSNYTHNWAFDAGTTGNGTWSTPAMGTTGLTITDPGLFNIVYSVTDGGVCTATATATFEVPEECNFEAEIADPCVCNNDAEVNADNGTFMEVVTVTGPNNESLPAGQIWTVYSSIGAYSASPINEETTPGPQGAPIAVGQVFGYCDQPGGCVVYNSAGGNTLMVTEGSYYLVFAHVDHEGYSFEVEGPGAAGDGGNVILSVSNVCFYPTLSIVSPTVACDTDGPITIQGLPNAVASGSSPRFNGDATFIGGDPPYNYASQSGLTDNLDGTAIFNPSVAGYGDHVISYTFEGNAVPNSSSPGCYSAVEYTFNVKATPDLTAAVTNVSCGDTDNGAINLTVESIDGVNPASYTYEWTGPNGFTATTEDISNLVSGNYTVTVSHPEICQQTATYYVDDVDNNTPFVTINGNYQIIAPQCTGSVSAIYQVQILDCAPINWSNLSVNWGGASAIVNYTGNNYREYIVTFPSDGSYLFAASYFNGENTGFVDLIIQVTRDTDSQQPVVTCPAPIFLNGTGAGCSASTTLTLPTYTDNCGQNATITYGVVNPDNSYSGPFASTSLNYTFSLGNSSIIWTVTDQAGNTGTCTQTVAVVDNTIPTIACPTGSPFARNNDTNECGYTAGGGEFDPTASDNCGDVTLSHNYGPWSNPSSLDGATFPVGTTTVTWTVTDIAGNVNSCTYTIVVSDNQNPVFVNCPNTTYTISADPDCSNGIIWPIPVASDNCPGVTVTQTAGPTPGTSLAPGSYTITYTATDAAGRTATCTFTINVVDDQDPTLVCPSDITIGTDNPNCSWTSAVGQLNPLYGVDNCPGYTLTYSISGATTVATTNGMVPPTAFNQGTSTITYTLTDAGGNTTTCSFDITVIDDDAPLLNCPTIFSGLLNIPADFGQCSHTSAIGATILDNCDNNLDVFALWTNPDGFISTIAFPLSGVDNYISALVTLPVGVNTIDLYARDNNNNEARCIVQVNVLDLQNPTLQCVGSPQARVNTSGVCGYVALGNEFDPVVATDNCPDYSLTHNYYAWANTESLGGATFPLGTTTVTWTIVDDSGNTSVCSTTIVVSDTELPVANCISQLDAVLDGDGATQILLTQIENGSSDNCGIASMGISRDGVNFGPSLYVNCNDNLVNVTLRVTDENGNSSTCQTNVNVYDLEIPDAQCQDRTIILNGAGLGSITASDIDAGSSDNCGIASLSINQSNFGCENVGLNYITLTVTDNRGNLNSCVSTVTVIDNTRPTFTCPAPVVVGSCNDVVPNLVALVTNADDNCGIASITQNPIAGQVVGLTSGSGFTALITVTDVNGNIRTCGVNITIDDDVDPNFINCPEAGYITDVFTNDCFTGANWDIPVATDDCAGLTIVQTGGPARGSLLSPGMYTITYTATDANGNTDICTFEVNVLDTENPVIECPDNIVTANDPGVCGAVVEYELDLGDNCELNFAQDVTINQNVSMAVSESVDCFIPVRHARRFDLSTITGNFSLSQVNFGVYAGGFSGTSVTVNVYSIPDGAPMATANLTLIETQTVAIPANASLQNFTANSNAVITDGNSIVLEIVTPGNPVFVMGYNYAAQTGVSYFKSADCGFVDYTDMNTVIPNAAVVIGGIGEVEGDASLVQNAGLPSGAFFPLGTTINTFTLTDDAGNSSSCSFTVTVEDTEGPVFTCPADRVVAGCAGTVPSVIDGLTGTDNCGGLVTFTQNPVAGTLFGPDPGDMIVVTVTATDARGNTTTCEVDLTITDTEMPYFVNCPQNQLVFGNDPDQCSAAVNWDIPVAMDNCDQLMAPQDIVQTLGNPPGSVFPVGGPYTIRYTATDEQGNSANCQFTFIVIDTQEPEILVGKPQNFTISCELAPPPPLVLNPNDVEDNCTPNPTINYNQTSSQNPNQANCGHYNYTLTRTWTVTDQAGNQQLWNQIITVEDKKAPTMTLPANVTVQCSGPYVAKSFTCNPGANQYAPTAAFAQYGLPVVSDNCAPSSVICVQFTETFTPGACGFTGTITRTWTATDPCGNTTSGVQTITIVDTTPPSFTCQDITVNLDANGTATIIVDQAIQGGTNAVTENCSTPNQLVYNLSKSLFQCGNLGVNQVLVTVSDACGNIGACNIKVTVRDLIPPVITCPANVNIQLGPGECRATTSARATATDNCNAVVTYSRDMFAPFEIGQTSVTATATDTYGNVTTCTFIVNVIEYVPVGNTMTCNNGINLSLDRNCEAVITADMILEGDEYRCYEKYCISITTLGGVPHANYFNLDDVGQTFRVIITDCQGTNNMCWGTITIEEKQQPKIGCPANVTIACAEDPLAVNNAGKLLTGEAELLNCEPGSSMKFTDDFIDNGTCASPRASINRIWTVTDTDGNTASCTQIITIDNLDLNDIVWPADRDFNNPIECSDAQGNPDITKPSNTGYPTLNGVQINRVGNLCNVSVSVSDEVYDICNASYEIIRTWKVRNMCQPLSASNPVTHTQVIKVLDTTAPKIAICPDDMIVSVGSLNCTASTELPLPEKIEDACNDITFKGQLYGSGDIVTTGTVAAGNLKVQLQNLSLGSHVVGYEFKDACGNRTTCYFNVNVVDLVPPIPVTKQYIVLGISAAGPNSPGSSRLYTDMVDNGSYDYCTGFVKVELRRPAGAPACDNNGNNGYNNNLTFNNNVPLLHGDDNVNDTDGGDYVSFCCADLATGVDSDGDGVINIGVHEVIMRVWDDADRNGIFGTAGDNFNESWAFVRLEDKSAPIITCPPAMTIQCDNPITLSTDLGSGAQPVDGVDFTLTGLPVSYAACGTPAVKFRDNAQLNQCGIGTITRDFFVGDAPVNQAPSCRQIIKVDPSTSNVAWVVTPPSSTKVSVGCEGPSADQIAQNKPTWIQGPCDVIGYSTDIKQFDFEDGVCRKWIVQYDLMNWCTNEAKGPYFKEFVFSDTENPQLSGCEPLNFGVDASCQTIVTLTKSATDGGGCIDNGWLKWIVFVDLWGDGTYDYEFSSFLAPGNDVANANNGRIDLIQDNNGNGIRDIYVAPTTNGGTVSIRIPEAIAGSMSNHKVDWKVTDGCHNYSACHQDFMVADQKAPTPYCVSLSSALMADPDGTGPQRPMVELWAKDFNVGSFDNCTDSDDLLFTFDSWAPQVTDKVVAGKVININTPHYFDAAGGVMAYPTTNATILNRYNNGELQLWIPAQRSSAKVWTDAVLPAGENKAVVQVQMSVWDGKFNVDFCMVELTLNCSTCPTTGGSRIAGLITTEAGQGVNSVQLALDMELPEFPRPATTDITGLYAFNDVPDGQAEITAAKSGDYMNGVSTFDIVMIQRHMLGIESFVSPYKVIAADINNDTRINSIDLVQLRSVILGVKNAFDNASWRFPVADQFIDINQVFPYQEKIGILIDGDKADNHFRAVKIGDVTGDVKVDVQNAQAEARTSSVLNLNIGEQAVNAGEIVEIPVTAENYKDIFGYQFTMNLTDATFEGIQAGKLQVTDANLGIIDEQTVTMSYAATQAENAVQDEVLFTISIKAAKAGNISQMMALSSEVTRAEAYMGTDIKVAPVKVTFTNASADQQIALLQNEPNPFREMTKVSFIMPQADQAVLKVFDVTGKVVATRNINAVKGMNTEVFTKEQLGASGVLYYQLETGNFSEMKKMIVIE